MSTLILYATKHGSTRIAAERIAAKLPEGATLFDFTHGGQAPDLAPYDTVIIGTSVYVGKPRKEAKLFCARNASTLLTKKLGLFLCCIQDLEKPVAQQLSLAFPGALRAHAVAIGALGGRVEYDKLRGLDKLIMKVVAGSLPQKTGNVFDTLSDERIDRFTQNLIK